MRRLTVYKHQSGNLNVNPKNSLNYMYYYKGPITVIRNFILVWLSKYTPTLSLKRFLLRMTGMKIGKNVNLGLCAAFDIFFPELIEIGDNTIIGYNATLLAHEFLIDSFRTGRIVVGKNVMIGAGTTVLPGVQIGDGAVVSAMSLVNRDVPPGSFVGGIPAKQLRRK